ncbi:MAG TPA: RluA family pseudouridine synthase [Flavobacteriaceae bacterium]|jgi:23S rRNA pseudouridine1911/1915/1917 synthase|nr:RluA family pseudouridine synthase [Flavobacteriaceae bacterium]HIN98413.1 RluA family pseudouridine synthase [Flavobacteriaceae bacterium]|tara:strand:+ start:1015 stop:1836 length:822 start_codon:yes stop_codon:yes gene_type:complete
MRIQEYAVGVFSYCPTKSALKKILKKGFLTVNTTVATTATIVSGGETICLNIPNEINKHKKFIFELTVIFEDQHFAVIRKPPGILVSGNSFKTVSNALIQNLKSSSLTDATQPQPVHRLDYATTGLLLIGKTTSSIRALNALFKHKEVEKNYYAITIGKMNSKGTVSLPIEGKKAISEYEVLKTVHSNRFQLLNLVLLKPVTGRRHQLRIHMANMGNPILGDIKYSSTDQLLKGKGMYLHACSLEFIHPFTEERMTFTDKLPKRFQKIFPEAL